MPLSLLLQALLDAAITCWAALHPLAVDWPPRRRIGEPVQPGGAWSIRAAREATHQIFREVLVIRCVRFNDDSLPVMTRFQEVVNALKSQQKLQQNPG